MKANRTNLILIVFLLISSCTKKEENQLLKGDIVGFVSLIDESGKSLTDKSGVNIAINNTSYSAITDINGRFVLKNVSAGTYTFIYSKENFGTFKTTFFQFIGGNVPALTAKQNLYQLPDAELQNLIVSYHDSIITITGTFLEESIYYVHIFLNNSANVSLTNYDYEACFYVKDWPVSLLSEEIRLLYTPFQEGETIYCKLYFSNVFDYSEYYDRDNNVYIKPSMVEASDVVEVHLED